MKLNYLKIIMNYAEFNTNTNPSENSPRHNYF